jgi:hypothetical protein
MDNLSFKIKKQERQDSVIASDWLRANGLNESYFASVKLIFIQAQQVASNLLTQHRAELNVNELRSLQIYLNAIANKKTRTKITKAQAYKVLNIGTKINRQIFKQYKSSVINNTPSVT